MGLIVVAHFRHERIEFLSIRDLSFLRSREVAACPGMAHPLLRASGGDADTRNAGVVRGVAVDWFKRSYPSRRLRLASPSCGPFILPPSAFLIYTLLNRTSQVTIMCENALERVKVA